MDITPDAIVYWTLGPFALNATILFSWIVMAVLVVVSWLVTRNLKVEPEPRLSRWQVFLESLVSIIRNQVGEITREDPVRYLPFIGSLFLFISLSNILSVIPRFEPPTGSITTTAALAICVFFAVPIFGITRAGVGTYLKRYLRPTPFMLPFNIIGELSRTLALAVRLFGNIMSGTLIIAILASVVPLLVPIVMQVLGLLIGQIQAYIFAVLATVYIASGTRAPEEQNEKTAADRSGPKGES